jgi:hypothetical protein
MSVYAQYNFDDTCIIAAECVLDKGARDGEYFDGAAPSGGRVMLDGNDDKIKICPPPAFSLLRGTLEIRFLQSAHVGTAPNTVLWRDTAGETPGGYRIEVLAEGAVQVLHDFAGTTTPFQTDAGFFAPGDAVKVIYSWDEAAGGALQVSNLTTNANFGAPVPAGLTMDAGPTVNQPWMIGAGRSQSDPGMLNILGAYFQGAVVHFSLSDTVDTAADIPVANPDTAETDHDMANASIAVLANDSDPNGDAQALTGTVTVNPVRDGVVRGAEAGGMINGGYRDPFDADRVDAGDACLADDAPDDDRILAGIGDDTVFAGTGDGLASGGAGNDTIFGRDDKDAQFGGADRDVFIVDIPAAGIDSLPDGSVNFIDGSEEGGDFDPLDLCGAGPFTLKYSPTNRKNGTVTFLDAKGNRAGRLDVINIKTVTPCFTPGTLIATPKGEVLVETLTAGDRVITRDNGIQEICWTGTRKIDWAMLTANPYLRPVMIRRGALGDGLPERDMMVSPNHRVLVSNDRTSLYFDEHEVLVAAKHLLGAPGIFEIESSGITYLHFMFAQHEVVLSNAAWTESFQPGDYTLNGMGNAQRSEILELFPQLKTKEGLEEYSAARRTLHRHEAKLLID